MLSFLRVSLLLGPPFTVFYGVSALLLRQLDLALMAGVLSVAGLLTLLGSWLARKGRLEAAALTAGYTVLGMAGLFVLILPGLYAADLILCLLGVVCVLPHVRGWPLKLYLFVTVAAMVLVVLVATPSPRPIPLPNALQHGLLLASITVPGSLICLLLWQYSTQLRRQLQHIQFLSHAGSLLASSLALDTTLQSVGQLTVPWFSDWGLLDLLDEAGEWRLAALIHADPRAEATTRALLERQGGAGAPPAGSSDGLEPCSLTLSGQDSLPGMEPRRVALLRALGPGSLLLVPLVARGRHSGVLTLGRTSMRHPFTGQDAVLAQELARRIAVAVDNARLFEQAQGAIRARDEFLAIASHELRTPLTPLLLKLHTLRRSVGALPLSQEATTWMEQQFSVIERQVHRLVRLLEEMLDISRMEGGRLRLELEPVDLAALVRELVAHGEESGAVARGRSEVRLTLPEEVIGRWDRLRLVQVITHLLSNAFKYGQNRPIDVEVRREGTLAMLVVRDRGIGISRENQERVFGRFERAVSVRHFGGFGQGLYIARQVVEAMGGTIRLESKPGEGSTFTVLLPLAGPATSAP